jgi:hypothetical protein
VRATSLRIGTIFKKNHVDALCMNGLVKQDAMGRMKKNKANKTKSISGLSEDEKENILLCKIIKTREEILDLLKVLKTF